MALIRNKDDLYSIYKASVQSQDAEGAKLTDWNEGSINDLIASAVTLVGSELVATMVDGFSKTLMANTEGADRDELVVDHYGEDFARLLDRKAQGFYRFSRPSVGPYVEILAGFALETEPDANGDTQAFVTITDAILYGDDLEVFAAIEAVESGVAGNVEADSIVMVDAPEDESIVGTNLAATVGGAAVQTDAEYQEYVDQKISQLRGGSRSAIEAEMLLIPGIAKATAHERFLRVKAVSLPSETPIGSAFTVVLSTVYIADANGVANAALLAQAEAALYEQRAWGVNSSVVSAEAFVMNWAAAITLNSSGPNYATLSVSLDPVKASMTEYLENLAIGDDFDPLLADPFIKSIWGPSGSNDLTSFLTKVPTGKVITPISIKIIPGTISLG